jgi:hypothetical protein
MGAVKLIYHLKRQNLSFQRAILAHHAATYPGGEVNAHFRDQVLDASSHTIHERGIIMPYSGHTPVQLHPSKGKRYDEE